MNFEFHIESPLNKTTNYDYFGETLRDNLEPLLVEEFKEGIEYRIRINTSFYMNDMIDSILSNGIDSRLIFTITKDTHYDYIGESVRDEIEDLMILSARKYDGINMHIRVIEL